MLGTIMFTSKIILEVLPNIHLLGMFTILYTVIYRSKALIPIYIYVFLNGIYAGFAPWWIPYLYIWTLLWGATMLVPKRIPKKIATVVYAILCALHGLLFGVLYAPAQAIMYGFNLEQTLAWIATGFTFDAIHCAGNLCAGLMILPLAEIWRKTQKG